MMRPVTLGLLLLSSLAPTAPASSDEGASPSVEEIARSRRESVVVISISGREGEPRGTGSGFIVRPDGVVATSFHVIGQGRPFTVQLASGATARPTAILAVDRARDLALFKIEGQDLKAFELGDSEALHPGQPVFSVGNPLGLPRSVTRGVVAEIREVEGRKLIQVAMPIEPGSSGSPLLDLQGRVVGVIATKSIVGSFGFAVPVSELKRLLEKPRPVPMARWLTIGALDGREWQTILGGDWRQRAGRIVATGAGEGFGGRTLCLSRKAPPQGRFEVSVEVRLQDESGAAGLAFHSDGGDRHYGFYPTGGALRLTCFQGPDVFHWTILRTVSSDHYRPGEWNAIKVRVEDSRLSCFVNDALLIQVEDTALARGQVGLVKFRQPGAEFRRFRVAPELPPSRPLEEVAVKVHEVVSRLSPGDLEDRKALDALSALGEDAARALRERAGGLEKEARRLRTLADSVHRLRCENRLVEIFQAKEKDIDLLQAALLLARLDNPDLEIEPYVELVDRLAGEVRGKLDRSAGEEERLRALVEEFREWGFHGSDSEYYHRSNSYLNEVLDDREGIPITLSIVFMELARRLDLNVLGLGLPGHFMVEWRPERSEPRLLDVFSGAKTLTRAEAGAFLGQPLEDQDFAPASKRQIVLRMLRNLLGVADRKRDLEGMLRYLDVLLALDPGSGLDRWIRAGLRFRTSRLLGAAEDLDWLLEHEPPGVNQAKVRELREILRQRQEG